MNLLHVVVTSKVMEQIEQDREKIVLAFLIPDLGFIFLHAVDSKA